LLVSSRNRGQPLHRKHCTHLWQSAVHMSSNYPPPPLSATSDRDETPVSSSNGSPQYVSPAIKLYDNAAYQSSAGELSPSYSPASEQRLRPLQGLPALASTQFLPSSSSFQFHTFEDAVVLRPLEVRNSAAKEPLGLEDTVCVITTSYDMAQRLVNAVLLS
jgi:hypothetical protein